MSRGSYSRAVSRLAKAERPIAAIPRSIEFYLRAVFQTDRPHRDDVTAA